MPRVARADNAQFNPEEATPKPKAHRGKRKSEKPVTGKEAFYKKEATRKNVDKEVLTMEQPDTNVELSREDVLKNRIEKFSSLLDALEETEDIAFRLNNLNSVQSPKAIQQAFRKLQQEYGIRNTEDFFSILDASLAEYNAQAKKEGPSKNEFPQEDEFPLAVENLLKWQRAYHKQKEAKLKPTEKRSEQEKDSKTLPILAVTEKIQSGTFPVEEAGLLDTIQRTALWSHADANLKQKLMDLGLAPNAGEATVAAAQSAVSRSRRFGANMEKAGRMGVNTEENLGRTTSVETGRVTTAGEREGRGADLFDKEWREAEKAAQISTPELPAQPKITTETENKPIIESTSTVAYPTPKPQGGLKNFFKGIWNKLTKPEISQKIDTKEKLKDILPQYQKFVDKLPNVAGKDFEKFNDDSLGLNHSEFVLLRGLLTGQNTVLDVVDNSNVEKFFKTSMDKVLKASLSEPNNKQLEALADFYIQANKDLGLGQISPASAERLQAMRGSKMASIGNPQESSGVGTPR